MRGAFGCFFRAARASRAPRRRRERAASATRHAQRRGSHARRHRRPRRVSARGRARSRASFRARFRRQRDNPSRSETPRHPWPKSGRRSSPRGPRAPRREVPSPRSRHDERRVRSRTFPFGHDAFLVSLRSPNRPTLTMALPPSNIPLRSSFTRSTHHQSFRSSPRAARRWTAPAACAV